MKRARLALAAATALAAAAGCGAVSSPSPDGETPPALARCVGSPFTPAPVQPWVHGTVSAITAGAGPAGHAMEDVVATPGASATIRGKLAYGAISKDLEDEDVRVFLDACSGWTSLGDFRTDEDGRISAPVPPGLAAGVYDVRLQVLGDATTAPGRIWILPAGTHLAIVDIDGTLTTGDEELVVDVLADLFEPLLSGAYVPAAYPGAAALTSALVGRGHVLVFLTGRPYWLTGTTREWLSSGGFALGPLHLAGSNAEALPTEGGVGAYKRAYLESLAAAGFLLDEAYGNATTDVFAYARAGIAPQATWIIGPNGGSGGTQAVSGTWEPRAAAIAARPPVTQPFAAPGS